MKLRLDKLLLERGLAPSRERAQALILAGRVLVNEQKVEKPGTSIANDAALRVLGDDLRYVSRGGAKLEDDEKQILTALAAISSSALGNAKLVEQIQHQALHDPMTGLANQALFEDRVTQAAAAARRTRERFAVMVLDIDAFKKVNDSLGHSQGNELLRLMGDRLVGGAGRRIGQTVADDRFVKHAIPIEKDGRAAPGPHRARNSDNSRIPSKEPIS